MSECFNALCGYDDDHEHGEECTIDCPCELGEMSPDGEWVGRESAEHQHGPRIVICAGCGQERWCGFGPCRCGVYTPCPASPQPAASETGGN